MQVRHFFRFPGPQDMIENTDLTVRGNFVLFAEKDHKYDTTAIKKIIEHLTMDKNVFNYGPERRAQKVGSYIKIV